MKTIVLNKQGVILSIHSGELNPILIAEELRPYIKLVNTITSEAVGKHLNDDGVYEYPKVNTKEPEEELDATISENIIPVIDFKLRMSSPERVAIKELSQTDAIVSDFMDILDDHRLTEVNLNSDTIQQSLAYLMSKGVFSEERVEAIKG